MDCRTLYPFTKAWSFILLISSVLSACATLSNPGAVEHDDSYFSSADLQAAREQARKERENPAAQPDYVSPSAGSGTSTSQSRFRDDWNNNLMTGPSLFCSPFYVAPGMGFSNGFYPSWGGPSWYTNSWGWSSRPWAWSSWNTGPYMGWNSNWGWYSTWGMDPMMVYGGWGNNPAWGWNSWNGMNSWNSWNSWNNPYSWNNPFNPWYSPYSAWNPTNWNFWNGGNNNTQIDPNPQPSRPRTNMALGNGSQGLPVSNGGTPSGASPRGGRMATNPLPENLPSNPGSNTTSGRTDPSIWRDNGRSSGSFFGDNTGSSFRSNDSPSGGSWGGGGSSGGRSGGDGFGGGFGGSTGSGGGRSGAGAPRGGRR